MPLTSFSSSVDQARDVKSAGRRHIPYRPEIDGLRAIAVLAVVAYHAGIGPAAGYAGVDIFFVISGYLITSLLIAEWKESRTLDITAFYARRMKRLLPALATVMAATLALGALLLNPAAFNDLASSTAAAILFGANIFFQAKTGGYFDAPSEEMPLLHLWSLAVEEQFYLVWPLMLLVILKNRPGWLSPVLVSGCLLSFGLSEWVLYVNPEAAFFQMPTRFWELAVGGMIAVSGWSPIRSAVTALMGGLLILFALSMPFSHFPGAGALPAVVATVLLLGAVHGGGDLGATGRLLRSGPAAYVGRLSYSLYLWHWPVLALFRATSVRQGQPEVLAVCVVGAILAVLTFRYVEWPMRRAGARVPNRKLVVAGLSLSLLLAGTVGAMAYAGRRQDTAPANDNPAAWRAEHDVTRYRKGCDYKPMEIPPPTPKVGCASARGLPLKVAIWGDSYASAWQPLAWKIAQDNKVAAADYSRTGCPAFLDASLATGSYRDQLCHDFNAKVISWVKGLDTVIIAVRWDARAMDVNAAGLRATLSRVAPQVGSVIVLGPSPVMPDKVPKCIRLGEKHCSTARADFEKYAAPLRKSLQEIVRAHSNASYLELSDFLCTPEECPPLQNGLALYSDDSHVSYSAASRFAETYSASARVRRPK